MMVGRTPEWAQTLVLKKCSTEAKPVYHDIVLEKHPLQQLKYGEVLVKINAASFNRREVCMRHCEGSLLIQRYGQLWQRLGQYPGIKFGCTLGADGAGDITVDIRAPETETSYYRHSSCIRGSK